MDLLLLIGAVLVAALLFTASLAAHELGHAIVARVLGLTVLQVRAGDGLLLFRRGVFEARLLPFSGAVKFGGDLHEESPRTRILVALAGPAGNILAAGLLALLVCPGGRLELLAHTMAMANFALAAFNLAPVPPLDGWHVLEVGLEHMGLQFTPAQRTRLYGVGLLLIMVATAVFFAVWWGRGVGPIA